MVYAYSDLEFGVGEKEKKKKTSGTKEKRRGKLEKVSLSSSLAKKHNETYKKKHGKKERKKIGTNLCLHWERQPCYLCNRDHQRPNPFPRR